MILLINPKTTLNSQIQKNYFREPSTGILYLAAILDLHGYDVDILDLEQYPDLDDIQLKNILEKSISKYEIFGITALTNTFHLALKIARLIKESDLSKVIITGGPHASFLYDEILRITQNGIKLFDFVCVGEAEHSFLHLIRFVSNNGINLENIKKDSSKLNSIEGISYLNSYNKVIFTGFSNAPINVEALPLPARYKLDPVNFYYTVANIIVNRGCPNQCSFCSRQELFKNVRIRSVDSILSEIYDIVSIPTYNYVNFYDNINISKDFLVRFCKSILKNRIEIPWGCELRVDNLSRDEVKLLKLAGCRLVAAGIESASEEILRKNFKYQDPEKIVKGISMLKEEQIPIQTYFVLGLPGETEQTFCRTIRFIKKLNFDQNDKINYFIATPYPGSRLWQQQEYFNINIIENDFSRYDCHHIIFETDTLKIKQLKKMAIISKKLEEYLTYKE